MEVLKDFRPNVQTMVLPGLAGMMTAKMKAIAYYLTGRTGMRQESAAVIHNRLHVRMIADDRQALRRHGFRS